MNVNELQSVQARERQSDSLQELRPSFYADAADFVAELREERARVAADAEDPFEDPEVTRLTDDIRTAEGTIEAIYERRVGKVVKLASLAAADMPAEGTGLTTEEEALYERLVGAIRSHREEVLATLGEDDPSVGALATDADRAETEGAAPAGREERPDAADVVDGESGGTGAPGEEGADGAGTEGTGEPGEHPDPDDPGGGATAEDPDRPDAAPDPPVEDGAGGGPDRTTVRITEDVGPILAVDEREYDLAADDVVTLPTKNATPLIERDAAEPLE